MYTKQLLLLTLFNLYFLPFYGMKNIQPQRWILDKNKLEQDIKQMFYTQIVLERTLNFDGDTWMKIGQNNPFFAKKIYDINYTCLCYAQNEPEYKSFCETYGINPGSYEDMKRGIIITNNKTHSKSNDSK